MRAESQDSFPVIAPWLDRALLASKVKELLELMGLKFPSGKEDGRAQVVYRVRTEMSTGSRMDEKRAKQYQPYSASRCQTARQDMLCALRRQVESLFPEVPRWAWRQGTRAWRWWKTAERGIQVQVSGEQHWLHEIVRLKS